MKGRHKKGDTLTLTATVTGVDEGGLTPVFKKGEDGVVRKTDELQGDTFVTVKIGKQTLTFQGSQLPESEVKEDAIAEAIKGGKADKKAK
ncbi:MAG TPA: hypothetical protein V6D22_13770 [Candidatus Obscuribacterales bacterium]